MLEFETRFLTKFALDHDFKAFIVADFVKPVVAAESPAPEVPAYPLSTEFHRTVLNVVVLTDDGPVRDDITLAEIANEIDGGNYTGLWTETRSESLTADQMRVAVKLVGIDPGLFGLDDDEE